MATDIVAPGNPAMIAEAKSRAAALANAECVGKRGLLGACLSGALFLALLSILTACAMGGPRVYRINLSCNFFLSNPDMEVLDYQFGDSNQTMTQMAGFMKDGDIAERQMGAGVFIPKPEYVYVKWRNMQTGKVFEDRADLRGRLPDGIDDYGITFFVKGPQLYVYLISPHYDRRPADWPKGPMKKSSHLKQWELYPNPTDFSSVKLLHRSDFGR